jgi:hypothetical protein
MRLDVSNKNWLQYVSRVEKIAKNKITVNDAMGVNVSGNCYHLRISQTENEEIRREPVKNKFSSLGPPKKLHHIWGAFAEM